MRPHLRLVFTLLVFLFCAGALIGCGDGPVIIPGGGATPTWTPEMIVETSTSTPVPTPMSVPDWGACGNPYWPIFEGATWEYMVIGDLGSERYFVVS